MEQFHECLVPVLNSARPNFHCLTGNSLVPPPNPERYFDQRDGVTLCLWQTFRARTEVLSRTWCVDSSCVYEVRRIGPPSNLFVELSCVPFVVSEWNVNLDKNLKLQMQTRVQ